MKTVFLKTLAAAAGTFWAFGTAGAQSSEVMFAGERARWLEVAEACKPELLRSVVKPRCIVKSVEDPGAFQGWRMEPCGSMDDLYGNSFRERKQVIVDFGEHLTGYYTVRIDTKGDSDAPLRLKFTFGEVPAELNIPFDPYPGGLSRAWLQDEIVTVMQVPATVTIPRRLSFRYVKIEELGSSAGYDYTIGDMETVAQTTACGTPLPLADGTSDAIRKINEIGLKTLKECMQTVYEDGPKRDQRLWIGDLYLESLANMYSYKNHDLTKRCLYLLAALADEEGWLHATVFESPEPHPQTNQHCMDYSLLYGVSLLEYLKATGDTATARDLWPVVARQVEFASAYLTEEYVYDMQKQPQWWLVFDWQDRLDRSAPIQGLMTFAIEKSYELACMLGEEKSVAHWPNTVARMKKASRKHFYDAKKGVVVSGPDAQVSHLSQVWMILSGTLTPKEGARALETAMAMPDACYPGSPYAYHYLIDALIRCGLTDRARECLTEYWGGMVRKGADTFWEVYDPNDDFKSPYGFAPVNSYCHAWSCTPVYFINKYPEIFQR